MPIKFRPWLLENIEMNTFPAVRLLEAEQQQRVYNAARRHAQELRQQAMAAAWRALVQRARTFLAFR